MRPSRLGGSCFPDTFHILFSILVPVRRTGTADRNDRPECAGTETARARERNSRNIRVPFLTNNRQRGRAYASSTNHGFAKPEAVVAFAASSLLPSISPMMSSELERESSRGLLKLSVEPHSLQSRERVLSFYSSARTARTRNAERVNIR